MAIVQRWFGATGAGAADGTSWNDRAQLFASSAWSTVITGFNFSGSDSLECLINGTTTINLVLSSGLFANPPTKANPLSFHGCDSSGNKLSVPNPDWISSQGQFDDSSFPVITTGGNNVDICSLAAFFARCMKFINAQRAGALFGAASVIDWCSVELTYSNSSAGGLHDSIQSISNSQVYTSVSIYNFLCGATTDTVRKNILLKAAAGSSGNRWGLYFTGTRNVVTGLTIVGVGSHGTYTGSASTANQHRFYDCTIANCGGDGIQESSVAGQTVATVVQNCMITGCGGYGINANSGARLHAFDNRLRDNASGNFNGMGNYPTDFGNYTTDSDDASEYVNAAGGDYRVKYGSAIWDYGFGAGRENASGARRKSSLRGGFHA